MRLWTLQIRLNHPIEPSEVLERLRELFTKLQPVLEQCGDSEVALASLAELKEPLNTWIGPQTVERILQRLFPEGPEQFRKTVVEKFEKRGFNDYSQKNKELLSRISWG